MEASTTIRKMMAGNRIIVPSYQRAYAWDTPQENSERTTQTDVFLSDLEEYNKSGTCTPYYFGHFLFKERGQEFDVIDGQQRLTTIVIFLSALFSKLRSIRDLTDEEEACYEDIIKRRNAIRFRTVDYDNQLFIDCVINQNTISYQSLETESSRRIFQAFKYFQKKISKKEEDYLLKMLSIVENATCTTHPVKNESEAIQMFIFQNNRGKRPSNLEIVKAQFMYYVHLYSGDNTEQLIYEIKNRFEKIYKSISSIDYKINEDDVLLYTLRVYFNSLWESNPLDRINKMLFDKDPINFIMKFTHSLSVDFENLTLFFGKNERDNFEIHSLVSLGGIGVIIPFVLKAYRYDLNLREIGILCSSLESLVLRHRLIGTRAEITSRINDVYEEFLQENKDIAPIVEHIDYLKNTTNLWWSYWNNENLTSALQGAVNHPVAKYLLWKYEVYLEKQGKDGYSPTRYDRIKNPELEHIAPKSEPDEKPHGYEEYDDEFKKEYLNCLGNYLLLSKSHNCAVGNIPFPNKLQTYIHNEQQREIEKFIGKKKVWGKNIIQKRKNAIVKAILEQA